MTPSCHWECVESRPAIDNELRQEIGRAHAWHAAPLASNKLLSRGFARWVGVFLFFSLAAVVQTWPLVLHATDSIVDWSVFPFDGWYYLWSFWWIKHALVELHTNPFSTDLLLYPQGADLHLVLPMVSGILSIPLQLATNNLILSSNVIILSSLVVSALGMYALAYRVTRNHLAAFLSGYIFAFAPYTLMRVAGHWNMSATWPIPFFVLFLLRFQDTARLRDAVGAGIFWALLTYNWVEYSLDAGTFLGLFVAYWSIVYIQKKEWARLSSHWRGFALIVAVWFVVSSPLLIPVLESMRTGEFFWPPASESYSADLLTFVTPSPLWGPGTAAVLGGQVEPYFHFPVGSIENTAYLGGVPLSLGALAIFAARRTPHRVLLWAATFLLFAILALGPYLYIDNTKSFSLLGVSFSVPLPYQLYEQIPLAGERRVPARMIVFGIMALSVLAGVGLDLLASWLKPRYKKVVPLAGLIALSLAALEYWNPPVLLEEFPSPPAIFDQIGDEPGDFSVLDVPLGRRSDFDNHGHPTMGPMTNYYQIFHGKAAFGGYIARVDRREFDWILHQPGLNYLACHYECPNPAPSQGDLNPERARQFFRQYRVKYVFLHSVEPGGTGIAFIGEREIRKLDSYLRAVLGLTPIYEDPGLTVYRNPGVE